MWVYISAKAKTIVLPHTKKRNFRGGNISQIISCTNIHNHCRKHRKFTQISSSYTIEHKTVRNSHLLLHKNWHFLKCHNNCSTHNCKLLICKIIKAAIDCSYIYCEGRYDKVLQTCAFSLQMHYCVQWY